MFYDSNPDDSLEVIDGKEIIDREGVEEMKTGNWTVAYLKLFKRELLENLPFPLGKYLLDVESTPKGFTGCLFKQLYLLVPYWFIWYFIKYME